MTTAISDGPPVTGPAGPGADEDSHAAHQPRFDMPGLAPALYKAQIAADSAVRASAIDPVLHELIKIRASQINGCSFCLDMHTQDAAAAGETLQRLNLLAAWREAPFYTAQERAALALTEAVTLVASGGVPDDIWADAAAVFGPEELAAVLMAIVVINGWNRIGIATGLVAGMYQRPKSRA
jgi:AhpD family alkylhydroperoxidase